MPGHNLREDCGHSVIIKFIDSDDVEMAEESWCDWITATTRWSHSGYENEIYKNNLGGVLEIVPVTMIQPLS